MIKNLQKLLIVNLVDLVKIKILIKAIVFYIVLNIDKV